MNIFEQINPESMKHFLFLLLLGGLLTGCEKETAPNQNYLTKVKFDQGGGAVTTYTIKYNADKKIERIDAVRPSTSSEWYYEFEYDGGVLDSVISYELPSGAVWGRVGADWTDSLMTFFWTSTYSYDGSNRVSERSTTSGNLFRSEYAGDSTLNYFDESGPTPEYLSWVTYRSSSVKNPFRIKDNESAFPVNSYVFNIIQIPSTNGMYEYAETRTNSYNASGTLTQWTVNTFEGNINGYPEKMISNVSGVETRILEFTYE